MEFLNFLISICQLIGLWLVFAIGIIIASVIIVFWWPLLIPVAIGWGVYKAVKETRA